MEQDSRPLAPAEGVDAGSAEPAGPQAPAAPAAEWASADAEAAGREGWAILPCSLPDHGPWQLRMTEETDETRDVIVATVGCLWSTDEHVWAHVWDVESDLHRKALRFLRVMSTPEWDAIEQWAADNRRPPSVNVVEWTPADELAAMPEGWGIFDCDGSENGPWQIQKFDDPDDLAERITATVGRLWKEDNEAWMHVWSVESALHRKAIAFIRAMNPQEWEAIERWAAGHGFPPSPNV